MGDDGHDRVGRDATQAWLTAAERAELGDLTSTVHPLWVAASVSVRSEAGGHVVVEVGGDLATGSAAYLDVVLEQDQPCRRPATEGGERGGEHLQCRCPPQPQGGQIGDDPPTVEERLGQHRGHPADRTQRQRTRQSNQDEPAERPHHDPQIRIALSRPRPRCTAEI